MAGARHPTIVIDSPVAEHFKILCRMRRLCVCLIKCVNEGSSVEGPLFRSVNHFRERKTGGFQRSRGDIRDMRKLGTDFTLSFDAFGPVHHHAIARSAKMRCDLLGPLERSVARPCPTDRIMGKSTRITPFIDMRHVDGGSTDDAV